MTYSERAGERPTKVLLATDLSARTDRALDRAALLASEWRAQLLVLHVLEEASLSEGLGPLPSWRRPPDPKRVVERQLKADLHDTAKRATVLVESGKPGEVIVDIAEAHQCDIIVVGLARNELLGRFAIGGTVDHLLRRSSIPILVVKDRARGPYQRIVVATDFSEPSRHALETAAHLFPRRRLTVFHAYDAPIAGVASDPAAYQREYSAVAAADCEAFLEGVRLAARRKPAVQVEWGTPAQLLRDYAESHGFDLVVLGTHGRGAVAEMLIGSVAKQILWEVPRDALVVRKPRAPAAQRSA